jgi:hypothetical protein
MKENSILLELPTVMNFKKWSEDYEQQQLVSYLEYKQYTYTSIPNSTFTKSWSVKAKNKALWLRPWMSDLIIILKRGNVLFLELKKARGKQWGLNWSVISKFQLNWQEKINECKWSQYVICHWYLHWIKTIESLEKEI